MLDNYLKVEKKVNIHSKFQNNTKDNLLKKMKECIYSQIDLPNATKDNLLKWFVLAIYLILSSPSSIGHINRNNFYHNYLTWQIMIDRF